MKGQRISTENVEDTLRLIKEKKVDLRCPAEMASLRVFDRCHPGLIRFGYWSAELTTAGSARLQKEKPRGNAA